MMLIDWDKLIRSFTDGRYCFRRKPGEFGRPVTVAEALDAVVSSGAKLDESHACVVELAEILDVQAARLQRIEEKLDRLSSGGGAVGPGPNCNKG